MNWARSRAGRAVVTVNAPLRSALLADLDARMAARQGFSVATLNLDHVVKLSRDTVFQAAYSAQTHVTADGNPVVWLSRLSGHGEVELVPGSELIDPVAALAVARHVPVAFFGSTDASLDAAATEMRLRHPGIEIVLTIAPDMDFDPEGTAADAAIAQIAASGARLVFLALGAPKQEIFAARAQDRLPEIGFLSVGAGLDFLSGAQRRAPAWMRAAAAEWLWRLLRDPSRLAKRYLACFVALPSLVGSALSIRYRRPPR